MNNNNSTSTSNRFHPNIKPTQQTSTPQKTKNPKPLAKCPFCGMTFKKLEHCQRHERTHTLARPYSCTVCLKTFARQDTLNRHLRLHSRSDGKMAINKSSPLQTSQASPPSPSKQPSLHSNPLSSPIHSNLQPLSGVTTFVSPTCNDIHPRILRDRGHSLSALEHSSLSSTHLTRDPSMINSSGPRQSISLPLQTHHHHHHHQFPQSHQHPSYPLHYNQYPLSSSQLNLDEIYSQPSESSSSNYLYPPPIEARRGSWCPGVQTWSDPTLLTSPHHPQPPPLPSTHRSYPQLPPHLSLGTAAWSKNLTNTFGLLEARIGPVPLSAPATCTNWRESLIGSSTPETSLHTINGTLVAPSWETHPPLQSHSQIHPSWPTGLGRLDEEEQIKLEPEPSTNSTGTSQLLLSSPSQPGSFDQLNLIETDGTTGGPSLTEIIQDSTSETTNPSVHWSFPSGGGNLSDPYLTQLTHPTSFSSSTDPLDCFGNVWQTDPKTFSVESFNPAYWNPTVCTDSLEDRDPKPIPGTHPILNPTNGMTTKNPWEEIVELDF